MSAASHHAPPRVTIGLNAVLAVVADGEPKVLCVRGEEGAWRLPYGPFDPEAHRTFEIGLRDWVERQTQVSLGYVEQLYTFGDKGREAPAAQLEGGAASDRVVSIGYLALASSPAEIGAGGAAWRSWYEFFPWEDWRGAAPAALEALILPGLGQWADRALEPMVRESRRARIRLAFGLAGLGWEDERALDRYELMYEAGLVAEARRDRGAPAREPTAFAGLAMISDHRRILATAIGRLRGKLRYRPVIFQLMAPDFTLLSLQRCVEAIIGFELHKQNFRRSIEQSGLVKATALSARQASGRPAAIFRVDRGALAAQGGWGLSIPRLQPAYGGDAPTGAPR